MRAALKGHSIGDVLENSHELCEFCTSLHFYLPGVLQEIHEEWKGEALDGIYPEIARKSDELQIEIAGLCIFLNDQTLTPIHVRLEISPKRNQVVYLDCKLGQMGPEGMIRTPYVRRNMLAKPRPATNWDAIDWVYYVGFDQRKDSINER
jgi:hypothetical protein